MGFGWYLFKKVVRTTDRAIKNSSKTSRKPTRRYSTTTTEIRIASESIADSPPGELIQATVLQVFDGDTVLLSNPETKIRVRLDGIDCPELSQPWGDIAKAGLIKLIGGRTVYIERHEIDDHGRTIGALFVMQGKELINVNERMVMLGHAWVVKSQITHLSKGRQHQLISLERWAKSKRVGLWKQDNPTPPWVWRKEQQPKEESK